MLLDDFVAHMERWILECCQRKHYKKRIETPGAQFGGYIERQKLVATGIESLKSMCSISLYCIKYTD